MDRRLAVLFGILRAMRGWVFALISLSVFANPVMAGAAPPDTEAMVFSIVRNAALACEPNCPEWIFAEGKIVGSSPSALKRILKQVGNRRLPVLINSPGGDVDAAIAMGRMIRARGLDTAVSASRFRGCGPRDADCKLPPQNQGVYSGNAYSGGSFCVSACPLMLAGGIERLASQWSYVGVHQVTTVYREAKVTYKTRYQIVDGKKKILDRTVASRGPTKTRTTTKLSKAMRKKLIGYFGEMGIRTATLDAMLSTPATEMRQLPEYQLLQLKLITRSGTADMLVASAVCKGKVPAGNCRATMFAQTIPGPVGSPKP